MDLQTIFVTGAASGIGRSTAQLFHSKGWFVAAYDVNQEGLDSLQEELGDRCTTALLDVSDKNEFDLAMQAFAQLTGNRLDLMFNNAGIAVGGFFDEVPFDQIMAVVNVNFIGVLNGIHAAIPLLKETDNSLCFTTSSSAATFGSPNLATYAATKHGVKGLTEALSVELSRYGVRAADVLPGIIDTAIWHVSRLYANGEEVSNFADVPANNAGRNDASRLISPDEVAECVWKAYHSDQLHWYVPAEIVEQEKAKVRSPEAMRDAMIKARESSN